MKPRHHPPAWKGLVTAVVAAGAAVAVAFGAPITETQTHAILAAVAVLAALVAGIWGDHGSTPQNDPHTRDGKRLVPADQAAAYVAAQSSHPAGQPTCLADTSTITEIHGDPHNDGGGAA